MQASNWLAPREAIVNNNNSPVAPIRGFNFGEVLGTMESSSSTTLNLHSCSVRTGKFVAVSLPISYIYGIVGPRANNESIVGPRHTMAPLFA